MKKETVIAGAVVLMVLFFVAGVFAQGLIWQDIGRGNTDFTTALIDPGNPRIIYAGTGNSIIKTEDGGGNWRNVLSIKGQNKAVNFLLFGPKDKDSLCAATGNGLFFSPDQGKNWKRIFRGKNSLENECTALGILPSGIYLGTKQGLFISKDNGSSWHKETSKLGNSRILAIAYHLKEPSDIYVACIDGVFKTQDDGKSWERIFVAHPVENGDDKDEADEDQDEEERFSDIRYVSIDPDNLNYLYIAAKKGIYKSQERGKTWYLLTGCGLLNRDIKFLLVSLKSTIYAVTKSGVFEYRNEGWYELSLGLAAENIRFLAQDNQGNLYAACDKGLFKANPDNPGSDGQENIIALYYKDEPNIAEVQEAAISYAEVDSRKIKEWRKKAQMKAVLPKLTLGIDRSKDTNYEIYTSATTKYIYEGPDDKSSGWDISLSWELGDLIWNESQTSIDVRSRLMVELRDDILDEVTKIYFERLRVKMELDNLSIEDRKKRFEKELRLQELTAYLDALTAGYFSQRLKNKTGF